MLSTRFKRSQQESILAFEHHRWCITPSLRTRSLHGNKDYIVARCLDDTSTFHSDIVPVFCGSIWSIKGKEQCFFSLPPPCISHSMNYPMCYTNNFFLFQLTCSLKRQTASSYRGIRPSKVVGTFLPSDGVEEMKRKIRIAYGMKYATSSAYTTLAQECRGGFQCLYITGIIFGTATFIHCPKQHILIGSPS